MTRGTVGLAAVLALMAAPVAAQDSAKVGFVATFSGPAAAVGNDMRDAFELALDHLGRKMGGLGRGDLRGRSRRSRTSASRRPKS